MTCIVRGLALILALSSVSARADGLRDAYKAYEKGQYEEAAKGFQSQAQKQPQDFDQLYNTGVALFQKGDHAGAANYFDRAKQSPDPKMKSQAAYNKGVAMAQEKRWDQAEKEFQEALSYDNDNNLIQDNLKFAAEQKKLQQPQDQQSQQNQQQANQDKNQQDQHDQQNQQANQNSQQNQQNQQNQQANQNSQQNQQASQNQGQNSQQQNQQANQQNSQQGQQDKNQQANQGQQNQQANQGQQNQQVNQGQQNQQVNQGQQNQQDKNQQANQGQQNQQDKNQQANQGQQNQQDKNQQVNQGQQNQQDNKGQQDKTPNGQQQNQVANQAGKDQQDPNHQEGMNTQETAGSGQPGDKNNKQRILTLKDLKKQEAEKLLRSVDDRIGTYVLTPEQANTEGKSRNGKDW